MRFAKKVDRSQSQIVGKIRDMGKQVIITNFGQDFPDLLVGDNGKWLLVEIKELDGNVDRGQMRFIAFAQGPVAVCVDSDEVMAALKNGGLTLTQKNKVAAWLVQYPIQLSLSLRKFRAVIV